MIKITPIKAFQDNYIWAMINEESRTMVVVDPGDFVPVLDFADQHHLTLTSIFITHHHRDHCGGVELLREKFTLTVFGPQHREIKATHIVKDKEVVFLPELNVTFQVLGIPGHTVEHVAFYCKEKKILFCGDTLFSAGCGRVFEGTYEQMWQTLEKILALPEDTTIYCAHEYTEENLKFAMAVEPENSEIHVYQTSVLGMKNCNQPTLPSLLSLEKRINPFLRVLEPRIITRVRERTGLPCQAPEEVFAALRQWKDDFRE